MAAPAAGTARTSPTPVLDLRSDVMAGPTDAMWDAMRAARPEVGWATFGEDPTVRALEARAAEVLGKPAALFVPTCGMANLVALLTLAERGTQVVVDASAHVVTSEAYGLAHVAGVFPRLLPAEAGRLDPHAVARAIAEPADRGLPPTTLVWLENTHTASGGEALGVPEMAALAEVAHRAGAAVYLDGARLPNAAAALGVPVRDLAAPADAVAMSLNKGLSAPFGAVLAGSVEFQARARLALRRLGGASIHQAGLFAAAGLVALEDDALARVAEDNRAAADLAARLAAVPGLSVVPARVRTNLVLVDTAPSGRSAADVQEALEREGLRAYRVGPTRLRFAIHRRVGPDEVARAAATAARVMEHGTRAMEES